MKSTKSGILSRICYEILRSKSSLRRSFFSSLAPSIGQDNSSLFKTIVASPSDEGQRKCPRSSFLKYSQKPSPSHSSIFRRSRFRLQNTNSASANGSRENPCCTSVIDPLNDFLMSVYPQHRYTGFPTNRITATSSSGRPSPVTPCLFCHLQCDGTHRLLWLGCFRRRSRVLNPQAASSRSARPYPHGFVPS